MLDKIKKQCIEFSPVGSRVTCDPAPVDTDADYLCLVSDMVEFRSFLFDLEFDMDGSDCADAAIPLSSTDRFSSYSLGEVNIIATQDAEFYRKFMAATTVAKKLNLLNKQDRIDLFQAVLYGNAVSESTGVSLEEFLRMLR